MNALMKSVAVLLAALLSALALAGPADAKPRRGLNDTSEFKLVCVDGVPTMKFHFFNETPSAHDYRFVMVEDDDGTETKTTRDLSLGPGEGTWWIRALDAETDWVSVTAKVVPGGHVSFFDQGPAWTLPC